MSWPQNGDILIARRTATVEHDVVIVPQGERVNSARYDLAMSTGREAAQRLGVDLWTTEDHIHFLRIATYRDRTP